MVALVHSAALVGVDARLIEVEAELSLGIPYFSVIGLGSTAIQEARYRIQAALRASEVHAPQKRITINLAPAALRKDGAALDLPMALSLLIACEELKPDFLENVLVVGELALNGDLRPVRGALSFAALARDHGFKYVIVPRENGAEASAITGISILAPSSLGELLAHLRGQAVIPPPPPIQIRTENNEVDFSEVRGQKLARRALEIAAAGGHNLLMIGNPGSGKTMLARRVPTILPVLSPAEQIEVTKIWSAAGLTIGQGYLMATRPFRSPHHTISEAGLIGGGTSIRPGEVSLAHRGVLFLDEMPEIHRRALECLRQPLEDREVVLSRAKHTIRLPASFMLIGAANPCPCGWRGHRTRPCFCTEHDVHRYLARISGPLIDRIDLMISAAALSTEEIMSEEQGETSAAIRARVVRAREVALARTGHINAELTGAALRHHARLDESARTILRVALERMELSARAVERTLRVARSIADLAGQTTVNREAVAEALQYRQPQGVSERLAA